MTTNHASWSVLIFPCDDPRLIKDQVQSLVAQAVPPECIFVLHDSDSRAELPSNPAITTIGVNRPGNFADAFAILLNSNTDYVCMIHKTPIVFGPLWFEWAVDCDKSCEGIYGINGMRYPDQRFDSSMPGPQPFSVDCLDGLWFFRKDHLKAIWENNFHDDPEEQEIYLNYVFQKYATLRSFVLPRHPDPECQPFFTPRPFILAPAVLDRYRGLGFETIREKTKQLRDYHHSLEYFFSKILQREPFSLIRYGDGEFFIVTGKTYKSTIEDDWQHTNTKSILKDHLKETFQMQNSNNYYGIHAPCDVMLYHEYYLNQIPAKDNLTFATLFCNSNFPRFREFVEQNSFDVVVIASALPPEGKIGGLNIIDSYLIDEKLAARWDAEYPTHLQNVASLAARHKRRVFFVAAGPVGKIFIHRMYQVNPFNLYCDIGSALDPFTKGGPSRAYFFPETPDSRHVCHF